MGKGVKTQLADLNFELGQLHDQALALFATAAQMGKKGEHEAQVQAKVDEANVLVERSKSLSEQIQELQSKRYVHANFQLTALTLAVAGIVIALVLTV
jgi:uncharacterized coiled-coil DUF342 family protein